MNRIFLFAWATICFLVFISFRTIATDFDDKYNEGVGLYNDKKYREAIKRFDEVLFENPLHINSYIKKSYSLYKLEQYEDALNTIEKAFEFEPMDSRYFFMKAQFYDKMGKKPLADHYINMAIKFNPTKTTYYNYRADLNLELGNYKSAISDYDFILASEPEKYNIYYSRGIAAYNSKNIIEGCLDWAYAQEKSKECQTMLHYKCSKLDLRPYERKVSKSKMLTKPVFDYLGDSSLSYFIKRFIEIPDDFEKLMDEGLVLVKIDINKLGKFDTAYIINSVSKEIDLTVLNVIQKTKEYWVAPAYLNSEPVAYSFVIPVRFMIMEPYFKEQLLLDSLNEMSIKNDNEKELKYLSEYIKLNPFNFEKKQRWVTLMKNMNKDIPKSLFIDYTIIEAEFVDEIFGYESVYKYYFDAYWRLTEKEDAVFYTLSKNDFHSSIYNDYSSYTIDNKLYSKGSSSNGKQDGKYIDYYQDGTIRCEMVFNDGQPINYLKTYYPNGILKHELLMNRDQFEFLSYNNQFGKSLFESEEIIWEFSHIHDGALDSTHLICNISINNKTAVWKLFEGNQLTCKEEYIKGKLKSCIVYTGGIQNEYDTSKITTECLIPMAAFYSNGIKYSDIIKDETLKLIRVMSENFETGIRSVAH